MNDSSPKPQRFNQVHAIMERLLNRGSGAVVGLVVAAFVSPADTGAYALATLALTFFQSLGEQTIRQIGVRVLRSGSGSAYIARASLYVSAITTVALAIVLLAAPTFELMSWEQAAQLTPLLVVPIVGIWSLPRVCRAQLAREWKVINRAQAIASLASLALAMPLAPIIGIGAASAQSAVVELAFLVLLPRAQNAGRHEEAISLTRLMYIPTAMSNLLGWVQGQADRLVVAIVGSAQTLGLVSLAVSVARLPIDAALVGYVNLLRAELAQHDDTLGRRKVMVHLLPRLLGLAIALQFSIITGSGLLLRSVLGADWYPALQIVPLVAASAPALAAAWALSAALIESAQARRMLPWQILGIALSVVAGVGYANSLVLGAVLVFGREIIAVTGRAILARSLLDKRAISLIVLSCLLGAALGGVGYWWMTI